MYARELNSNIKRQYQQNLYTATAAMSRRSEETVEKIYQKKTLLEQILLRPDTYIGSVESFQQYLWVYDKADKAIVYKKIEYVPGLFKIFGIVVAEHQYRRNLGKCIRQLPARSFNDSY